jgi:hypothetical protein
MKHQKERRALELPSRNAERMAFSVKKTAIVAPSDV